MQLAGKKHTSKFLLFFQVEISKVATLCKLFESLFLAEKGGADFSLDENRFNTTLNTTFAYAYFWGLSGNLNENSQDAFDTFAKDQFSDNGEAKVIKVTIFYELLLR